MKRCLSDDSWKSNQPEMFVQREIKARKEHRCCECGDTIKRRDIYENSTGKWDGSFLIYKTCLICREIREGLYCGGYTFEHTIEYVVESIKEGECIGPEKILKLSDEAREKISLLLD